MRIALLLVACAALRKRKPLPPPPQPKSTVRGVVAVAGGTMVHMVLGTLYCWGNFIGYAPDYLKYFSKTSGPPDALTMVPLAIVFQTLGLPFGAELNRIVGTRAAAMFGGLTVAFGVFASSFARRLSTFMVFYGVFFGLGIGFAYTAPMTAGWTYFPNRKGLVNGLVLMGFGAGGFIFNLVGSKLVNPEGLSPPYPAYVSANFPMMLRRLGMLYAAIALVGGACVVSKEEPTRRDTVKTTMTVGKSVPQALGSITFYALYLIIMLTASAGLTFASVYKIFATSFLTGASDNFLATAGALGAVFNGLGRLFWAASVDTLGFKRPFALMLALQAANTYLVPLADSLPAYLLATCVAFFCLGGTFSTAPTCCALAFGAQNAPRIYSLLFTAFACASIGGVEVAKKLVPTLGWTPVFKLLSAASVGALVVLPLLDVA